MSHKLFELILIKIICPSIPNPFEFHLMFRRQRCNLVNRSYFKVGKI